jgi:hypothetical protein
MAALIPQQGEPTCITAKFSGIFPAAMSVGFGWFSVSFR